VESWGSPLIDEFRPSAKRGWNPARHGTILSLADSAANPYEEVGERQTNHCGGGQYGRPRAAAPGSLRHRQFQRAGLPGSGSKPRVLRERQMGPAQVSLSLPSLLRCLSEVHGERGSGAASHGRVLRPSCPGPISRDGIRRIRSDWSRKRSAQWRIEVRFR
jgi:hypothetical protein